MNIKKKVLITGGTGLLGVNWALTRRGVDEVILGEHLNSIDIKGVECIRLDISSAEKLLNQLKIISPDVVINAVAITDVDSCETNPLIANQVNALFARNVADVASLLNLPLVHISTDMLFNGGEYFKTESASLSPVNAYARSKEFAESLVLKAHPESIIVRTNFFGWGPPHRISFSDFILKNLRERNRLRLFEDVFFSPILISRLVELCHALLDIKFKGIINLVGDERISKYEFGLKVANQFKCDSTLIDPVSVLDARLIARRPNDMSLSNSMASNLLGLKIGNIDSFLAELEMQEIQGLMRELRSV